MRKNTVAVVTNSQHRRCLQTWTQCYKCSFARLRQQESNVVQTWCCFDMCVSQHGILYLPRVFFWKRIFLTHFILSPHFFQQFIVLVVVRRNQFWLFALSLSLSRSLSLTLSLSAKSCTLWDRQPSFMSQSCKVWQRERERETERERTSNQTWFQHDWTCMQHCTLMSLLFPSVGIVIMHPGRGHLWSCNDRGIFSGTLMELKIHKGVRNGQTEWCLHSLLTLPPFG